MPKRTHYLTSEAYNLGYEDGQKDQRKIDIEKACEAHCKICYCNEWGCVSPEWCEQIKIIKQAMEE